MNVRTAKLIQLRPERRSERQRGFTLIELLLVVALIAILLGIITPMHFRVREHARGAKARATAKHLEIAFREYYNYHREWPGSDGEIVGGLYNILRGDGVGPAFVEFEGEDDLQNPWGEPYHVRFDSGDNRVTSPSPGGGTIYRSVIVWTETPEGEIIGSWE